MEEAVWVERWVWAGGGGNCLWWGGGWEWVGVRGSGLRGLGASQERWLGRSGDGGGGGGGLLECILVK